MTNTPFVISIEGGEGAGKTTIIERLNAYLKGKSIPFMVTREPGGVRISEAIRQIILSEEFTEMDARTEALLFAAARRQHLTEKVIPALNAGKSIIFDRFVDSSMVYQGYVRGIGVDEVYQMNVFATEGFLPQLTIYLDIDPEIGIHRILSTPGREINKLDQESMHFHEKVREGYLILCDLYPKRIVKIDATGTENEVFECVLKEIELFLQRCYNEKKDC